MIERLTWILVALVAVCGVFGIMLSAIGGSGAPDSMGTLQGALSDTARVLAHCVAGSALTLVACLAVTAAVGM